MRLQYFNLDRHNNEVALYSFAKLFLERSMWKHGIIDWKCMKTFQQKTSMRGKSEISTISISFLFTFASLMWFAEKRFSFRFRVSKCLKMNSLKSPLFDIHQTSTSSTPSTRNCFFRFDTVSITRKFDYWTKGFSFSILRDVGMCLSGLAFFLLLTRHSVLLMAEK